MHVWKQGQAIEGLADANACGTPYRLSLRSDASSVTVSVMAAAVRPSRAEEVTLCRVHLRSALADHRTRDSRLVLHRPWGMGRLTGLPASAALNGWDELRPLLRHVSNTERLGGLRPSRDAAPHRAGVAAALHIERHALSAGAAGLSDKLLRLQANGTSAQWARCKGSGRASGAGKYISVTLFARGVGGRCAIGAADMTRALPSVSYRLVPAKRTR